MSGTEKLELIKRLTKRVSELEVQLMEANAMVEILQAEAKGRV
jgi:hypothetical protein